MFFKIQVIEIFARCNPCWHITRSQLEGKYLGNCPANSLFRNPNLKFVLGRKDDDRNLYHSLPTQTTLGSSGSWLTAIQERSLDPVVAWYNAALLGQLSRPVSPADQPQPEVLHQVVAGLGPDQHEEGQLLGGVNDHGIWPGRSGGRRGR